MPKSADITTQQSYNICGCSRSRNTRYTLTRLTALFPGLSRWAGTRNVKSIWILLKQETVSGSGISSAICKSAPRSRQITTPAPHQQRQGTADSNCCTTVFLFGHTEVDGKPAGKCYTTGYYAERTYRPTAVIKSVLKRYGVRPSVRLVDR